jgi:hypothetical protein
LITDKKYDYCFEENLHLDGKICHLVVSIIALVLIIMITRHELEQEFLSPMCVSICLVFVYVFIKIIVLKALLTLLT